MAKELTPEEQELIDRKAAAAQAAWQAYWTPSTLFPLHSDERLFSNFDFFFLGLAAAMPVTMLSIQSGSQLSTAATFFATALAIVIATLAMWPLAKISQSYGLGSAILFSGLLGQYGAKIISSLRALWALAFFAETTVTMALLIHSLFAARFPNATILPFALGNWHLSLNLFLLLAALLTLQFFFLRGGLKRLLYWLKKGSYIYLGGLVILAIWLLTSYTPKPTPAITSPIPTTFPAFLGAMNWALLILAPLVFSCPDYFRYAKQKSSPAPFILGGGLLAGQLILFIVHLLGQRYLGYGAVDTPLNWLTASYQPLISWPVVLTMVVGCLLANFILNGYPAAMSAVLNLPGKGLRPWQITLIAAALPAYWLLTCLYRSNAFADLLKGGSFFFWLAALMLAFYYGVIKKFRFNQSQLYYKPASILAGFKVLTLIVLILGAFFGFLLLSIKNPSHIATFVVALVPIWLPVLAAIGQIGCYFVPGLAHNLQHQRQIARVPLDRRPTPSNMVPVPEATGTDIIPRAPGRNANTAVIDRMKERKKQQEWEEEQRRARQMRHQEKVSDNVKSWLE